MREDVKKYLFVGVSGDKAAFFQKAQDVGLVHFIDTSLTKTREVPQDIEKIAGAIKVLRGVPAVEQEDTDEYAIAVGLAQKILDLKHAHERLEAEQRITQLDIARVEVFGDFSPEDVAYIEQNGHRKIQFYFARQGFAVKNEVPADVLYVGMENNLEYYVGINDKPMAYDKMVEMKIDQPVGMLQKRQVQIEQQLHDIEQRLKGYAKYNEFLHHAMIQRLNSHDLQTAQNSAQMQLDDTLFAVEGWVPVNKTADVQALAHESGVHMEEVAVEETDRVPTCLQNEGVSRVGEDLVHIYDTPSATDKDPSLWVLGSFALFFSFIVGDAGYGLVFLLIALYIRYKMTDASPVGKRTLNLVTILCTCVIVWGVLTNSFFGLSFDIDSPLRKVSVMNWLVEKKTAYHISHQDAIYQEWVAKYPKLEGETDPKAFIKGTVELKKGKPVYELVNRFSDNILFELALFIGVVHIGISLIRYMTRNWAALGWILFLIGAYLYLPEYLHATSLIHFVFGIDPVKGAQDGLYLIFGGATLAVVIAIFKHKFLGVLEAMTMVQIFADVMSYLRLYALGLAGAIMTGLINEMAESLVFVVGIVLVVLGHIVNMVLSIMGGVIHGLRLNFIEWYHYSFEGGGLMFKPLRKLFYK